MIKSFIVIVLLLFLVNGITVYAQLEQVYLLSLKYVKGEVSVEEINVVQGVFIEPKTSNENFRLEIVSFTGEVLYGQRFGFKLEIFFEPLREWFDDQGRQIYFPTEEEAKKELDESSLNLILPYFPNAKEINIYNVDNALLMNIDVTQFSITCGNNICEPSESYFDCRQDCPSGIEDRFCDQEKDGICDPDCSTEQDVDCTEIEKIVEENITKPHILAVIIAILVLIVLIVFVGFELRKIKDKENLSERYQDKDSLRLRAYIEKKLNKGLNNEQIRNTLIKNGWNDKKIGKAFKELK